MEVRNGIVGSGNAEEGSIRKVVCYGVARAPEVDMIVHEILCSMDIKREINLGRSDSSLRHGS